MPPQPSTTASTRRARRRPGCPPAAPLRRVRCAGSRCRPGWPAPGQDHRTSRGRPAGRPRADRPRGATSCACAVAVGFGGHVADQLGQRHQHVGLGLPRALLDAGQCEEVVHQHGHPRHRAPHLRHGAGDVVDHPVLQTLGQRPQSGQRGAQIVGHEADQLLPGAFGRPLPLPGLGEGTPGIGQVRAATCANSCGAPEAGASGRTSVAVTLEGPAELSDDQLMQPGADLRDARDDPADHQQRADHGEQHRGDQGDQDHQRVVPGEEHQLHVDQHGGDHGEHRQQRDDDQLITKRSVPDQVQQDQPRPARPRRSWRWSDR